MGGGSIKGQPSEASSQSRFGSCLSDCSQMSFRAGKRANVIASQM